MLRNGKRDPRFHLAFDATTAAYIRINQAVRLAEYLDSLLIEELPPANTHIPALAKELYFALMDYLSVACPMEVKKIIDSRVDREHWINGRLCAASNEFSVERWRKLKLKNNTP